MNTFLVILELYAFYIEHKKVKFMQLTFEVEPMLNILSKHSFCSFVKIMRKFFPFPLLKTTTKSTHFFSAKKKKWIELQTNKVQKVSKPYI